jgi:predicted methyltransferase
MGAFFVVAEEPHVLTRFALIVLAWIASAAPAFAQSPHTHAHGFGDAQKWSKIFDDPQRDAWQKPHEVIEALALAPDAVVADVGAGTGYFAVRLAHKVPKGRVYAIDTEANMVQHLASRAREGSLKNITAVLGSPDDPRIPDKADLVLFVDVYHHIENRERYFRNVAKALKAAGRVVIVDFRMDSPHGPPRSARIEPQQVKAELAAAGYELAREHAFLPYQYFLEFVPVRR